MRSIPYHCDEKQSSNPEFSCHNRPKFGLAYTRPDDHSGVRYACTIHLGKAAKWVTKHRHPIHDRVLVVDLEEE